MASSSGKKSSALAMNISFSTDKQDRMTQECGTCHKTFKVTQAFIEPLEFCPFCGAPPVNNPEESKQGFMTDAQFAYGASIVSQQVMGQFENVGFEVTYDPPAPKPVETEDDMPETTTSACCKFTITNEAAPKPQFCGACGKKLS